MFHVDFPVNVVDACPLPIPIYNKAQGRIKMMELDYDEVAPWRKYPAKLDADKADRAFEHLYSDKEKNEAKSLKQILENMLNPIAKEKHTKVQYWIKHNSPCFQGIKVKSALVLTQHRPEQLSDLIKKYEAMGVEANYHPKSLTLIFHMPRGWYRQPS